MTQMGLDYLKYKESGRHNLADESIRSRANDVAQQEADTRRYVASFEDRKTTAAERQAGAAETSAEAAKSQANTAQGRLALDQAYREREMVAKENTANAALSQAKSAQQRADVESTKINPDSDYFKSAVESLRINAEAAKSNAATNLSRQQQDQWNQIVGYLSTPEAAAQAAKKLGYGNMNQFVSGINGILSQLLGGVTSGLGGAISNATRQPSNSTSYKFSTNTTNNNRYY